MVRNRVKTDTFRRRHGTGIRKARLGAFAVEKPAGTIDLSEAKIGHIGGPN